MNKKFSRVFAMILALTLCMAMAIPVLADMAVAANGTGSLTVKKNLIMDKNANVPAGATFHFELTAAEGNTAPDYDGVMEGVTVDGAAYTEAGVNVVFTGEEETTDVTPAGADATVTQKYATETFTIDFTGVDYKNPGVYHYELTETDPEPPYSVTDEAKQTQYIDVYVVIDDQTGELAIQTVVLYVTEEDLDAENTDSHKNEGFDNDYNTIDLTLTKTVAGNQGNRNEYFEFLIKLTDVAIDGTYIITGETGEVKAGKIEVKDGKGEATVWLKHDDSIAIEGLPAGTSYEIVEQGAEDYETKVNGEKADGKKATGTELAEDTAVAYTNTRGGTIPTGILLTVAPFAALMVIGIAGVLFVTLKKRNNAK